jgi:hypothetical protein
MSEPRDGSKNDENANLDETSSVMKVAQEAEQAVERDVSKQQYKKSVKGFSDILNEILNANRNTIDWLDRFRDFDFDHNNFNNLKRDYHRLANETGYRQLKWSCHRVSEIYRGDIEPTIGSLLKDGEKITETQRVFSSLEDVDEKMITFVKDEILTKLDSFVKDVEPQIDKGYMHVAKSLQSRFKNDTQDFYERLSRLNEELDNLVIKFNGLTV